MTDEDNRIHDGLVALLGIDTVKPTRAYVLITTEIIGHVLGGDTNIIASVSPEDYVPMLMDIIHRIYNRQEEQRTLQ